MRFNFEKFLLRIALIIALIAIIKTPAPKPTTWSWADAHEAGMSWNEYMEVMKIDD